MKLLFSVSAIVLITIGCNSPDTVDFVIGQSPPTSQPNQIEKTPIPIPLTEIELPTENEKSALEAYMKPQHGHPAKPAHATPTQPNAANPSIGRRQLTSS